MAKTINDIAQAICNDLGANLKTVDDDRIWGEKPGRTIPRERIARAAEKACEGTQFKFAENWRSVRRVFGIRFERKDS